MRELLLDDPAPFVPLTIAERIGAKAATLVGRCYIVFRISCDARTEQGLVADEPLGGS